MPSISSTERIYLRLERAGFPCDIAGINVLEPSEEGELPFEVVRAVFDQRSHQSPFLSLMLAQAPLGIGEDRWTHVESLDIDAHVFHRQIPQPGDTQALLATVLEVTADPLDRDRPLWQAWYLTGMADGSAALVLRAHHAAIDGMGALELHGVLFDTEPTPVDLELPVTPVAGRPFPSHLRRALVEVPTRLATQVVTVGRLLTRVAAAGPDKLVAKPLRALLQAAPRLGSLLRPGSSTTVTLPELPGYIPSPTRRPPVTLFNRHVTDPTKSMAVTSVPLDEVKAVRRAFPEVTVNDTLFALVAGSLRDYLIANDDLPAEPLRATCPVNIRLPSEKDGRGNFISTIWIDLPVHLSDPAERLLAVHASAAAAKASLPESQASWEVLADVGDLFFPSVVSATMAFAGSRPFGRLPLTQNLTVSTMNGSSQPLYLATRRISHMYGRMIICPPIHLFVQATTYAGSIDISVTTVQQLCPDPQRLAEGMRTELDRLLALGP